MIGFSIVLFDCCYCRRLIYVHWFDANRVFIQGLKKISSSSSLGHYQWHPQNFPWNLRRSHGDMKARLSLTKHCEMRKKEKRKTMGKPWGPIVLPWWQYLYDVVCNTTKRTPAWLSTSPLLAESVALEITRGVRQGCMVRLRPWQNGELNPLDLRFAVEARKTQLLRVGLLLDAWPLRTNLPRRLPYQLGCFSKFCPVMLWVACFRSEKVDSFEARYLRSIFGQA